MSALTSSLLMYHSIFSSSVNLRNHRISLDANVNDGISIVDVSLADRSYPIYIGRDILKSQSHSLLNKHVNAKKALIVTNNIVGPLYAAEVSKQLQSNGIEVFEVSLPDGEEFKTIEYLNVIIDAAMDAKLDRKSILIALGGGVVGDMTGFAAAIYQRGIRFIQVPTTVMAMVDSSVGGKTAVNHPKGKNMIGAFYQPDTVIIDIATLQSLPDREFYSGLAEVIKYGLIGDVQLFEWLEKNIDLILRRDDNALIHICRASCENKSRIVSLDEKETGLRATLNFGHTFGHAIETGMGYGTWLHGEAVALGMLMATRMSSELKWIDNSLVKRLENLLNKCHLPTSLRNEYITAELGHDRANALFDSLDSSKFLELMSFDKKVANGKLNLILLRGEIGNCIISDEFPNEVLQRTIEKFITVEKD